MGEAATTPRMRNSHMIGMAIGILAMEMGGHGRIIAMENGDIHIANCERTKGYPMILLGEAIHL